MRDLKRSPEDIQRDINKLTKELEESKRLIPKSNKDFDYIDLNLFVKRIVEDFYLGKGKSLNDLSKETLKSIAFHAFNSFYSMTEINEFLEE